MSLIPIALFATLGLVGQAPGGPDEESGRFPVGGWQAPLSNAVTAAHRVAAAVDGLRTS